MSIITNLQTKSNERICTDQAVIEEITKYFKEKLDTVFEKNLEERISDSESALRDKEYTLVVEFWAHHSGCSGTHFKISCAGIWENPDGYDKHSYNGVNLNSIQIKVGELLLQMLKNKLTELGFTYYDQNKMGWLQYFDHEVTIRW